VADEVERIKQLQEEMAQFVNGMTEVIRANAASVDALTRIQMEANRLTDEAARGEDLKSLALSRAGLATEQYLTSLKKSTQAAFMAAGKDATFKRAELAGRLALSREAGRTTAATWTVSDVWKGIKSPIQNAGTGLGKLGDIMAYKFQPQTEKLAGALSHFNLEPETVTSLAKLSPVLMVAQFVLNALWGTFKGGIDVMKIMNASSIKLTGGLMDTTSLFAQMSWAGAKLGASTEDVLTGFKALTGGYAVNRLMLEQLDKEGMSHLNQIAETMGATVGMSKMLGMNAEQTGKFMNALGLMGDSIKNSVTTFKDHATAARVSLLNMNDYVDIMNMLTPSTLLLKDGAQRTKVMLESFGIAIRDKVGSPIMELVRTLPGGMAQITSAIKSFMEISAGIQMPMAMAFGGGAQMGAADPLAALRKATTEGFQPQILQNYLAAIAQGAATQNEGIFGMATALNKMGMTYQRSLAMAELLVKTQNAMRTATTKGARDQAEKELKGLEGQAAAAAAIQDPLKYISQLMERLIGMLTTFMSGPGGLAMSRLSGSRR
jgi:hypothetical protein